MSGAAVVQRVEMQFSVGVWTDVSTDLVSVEGLRWRRGIDGRGPTDCVASAGQMSFTLRNDAGSGHPQGYYTVGHANQRTGFEPGIPVRVVYRYNSTDYGRWRGKLATADPAPGMYETQRVRCIAVGTIADLIEEKISAIAPQLNQTEVQLLTAALAAVSTAAQPPATDFDTAVDTYTYAFDDLEAGTAAATIIHDLMVSAGGFYVETGDATHRYISRAMRALALSQFAFTDAHLNRSTGISRPTALDTVFNVVRTKTHAKQVGASDTDVLCSHEGRLAIEAGQTVEFFIPYRDPDTNDPMGGTDFQEGVNYLAGTDYEFNDAEDGGGADVTADIDITATFFASTLLVNIENTGAVTAYKQILQGRGRTIKDLSPTWSEGSVTKKYVRTLEVDLRYQDDAVVGKDRADYYAAQYADNGDQIDSIEFIANLSDALMLQAMQLEIGDVVTVTEAVTGTVAIDGYIQWIEFTVTDGPFIVCRLGLAPRIERQLSQNENISIAESFVQTSPAPSTLVDVALVDFSEAV